MATNPDYSWLTEEDLLVTPIADGDGDGNGDPAVRLLVRDTASRYAVVLAADEDNTAGPVITVNGDYYYFGDSYPQILGLWDEAEGKPTGEEFYSAVLGRPEPGPYQPKHAAPNRDQLARNTGIPASVNPGWHGGA